MDNTKKKTLCIVAGGSGGHLIPALELARQWLNQHSDGQITLFTTTKKIDDVVVQQYPWIHTVIKLTIPPINVKNPITWTNLLLKSLYGFYTSMRTFKQSNIVKIISTGGFIALPVCLAGKFNKIPIDLYELNAIPGKAAHVIALLASRIVITFSASAQFLKNRPCEIGPYPIRFKTNQQYTSQQTLIEHLNTTIIHKDTHQFSPERKTIFLLGGSQGSRQLNYQLRDFLQTHHEVHQHIQIIHQTGSNDDIGWNAFYHSLHIPAIVFSYTQDIESFYLIADLVITRAGAGTLFELLFFKKTSLIVPLITHSTDHQRDNAQAMVNAHPELFLIIDQDSITQHPEIFYQAVLRLLSLETTLSLLSQKPHPHLFSDQRT